MEPVTLIISTSSSCGHCRAFIKNERKKLLDEIKGRVEVFEYNFGTRMEAHPGITKYIGWQPSFILVPTHQWNDKTSNLDAIVMAGKMVDGAITFDNTKVFSYKSDIVAKWVDDNVDDPIFDNKSEKTKYIIVKKKNTAKTVKTRSRFVNRTTDSL